MSGKGDSSKRTGFQQLNKLLILSEFIFLLCLLPLTSTVAQTYISLLPATCSIKDASCLNAAPPPTDECVGYIYPFFYRIPKVANVNHDVVLIRRQIS